MAYLFRLIALSALLVLSGAVHAAFPATPTYQYSVGGGYGTHHGASTGEAWASLRAAAAALTPSRTLASTFEGSPADPWANCATFSCARWVYEFTSSGYIGNQSFTMARSATGYSCPTNSTLAGSSCECNAGYVEDGASCVAPADPAAEYCTAQSTNPAVGVSAPRPTGSVGLDSYTMCYSNQYSLYACSGTLVPDICGTGVDGKTHCTGKVTFSGSTPCTGTTQPQEPEDMPAPLPEAPPAGQCPGEVNGVAVYVPCSNTSSSSTKTNETTNSSGTTQTSETRNTTCNAAGSCTTTVTTTTTVNGGSPSTSTSTTTQDKGDFCTENPGSRECGQQSSFGGACASGFVCQGDAVQCAMAKELHAQWCRDNQATDESALYAASKGAEGDQTGDLPGNETIPFGPSSYDDSDAIGGAACVTDLTIEHEWLSATLPLSMICGPLLWFKNALLFIGGIAWLLIVFRRR